MIAVTPVNIDRLARLAKRQEDLEHGLVVFEAVREIVHLRQAVHKQHELLVRLNLFADSVDQWQMGGAASVVLAQLLADVRSALEPDLS